MYWFVKYFTIREKLSWHNIVCCDALYRYYICILMQLVKIIPIKLILHLFACQMQCIYIYYTPVRKFLFCLGLCACFFFFYEKLPKYTTLLSYLLIFHIVWNSYILFYLLVISYHISDICVHITYDVIYMYLWYQIHKQDMNVTSKM